MPQRYHLILNSDPAEVRRVESLIEQVASELQLEKNFRYDLMLIVTEATNNAILHGNKQNPSKKATLTITVEGDDLQIIVTDEGKGFDPNAIPNPLAQENLLKSGGRGVFLMKQMAKTLDYDFSKGGTRLSITLPIVKA